MLLVVLIIVNVCHDIDYVYREGKEAERREAKKVPIYLVGS